MRLLWLPDVLRDAGLTVREYDGWRTRGVDSWGPLRGVVCHATAGSRTSTDAGETRVLWVTGSLSAPAPISQLYLSRSGEWTVGASGRCNHVLVGDKGPHRGFGNSFLIGIEAQNDNRGEPWPAAQLRSYERGVAAICRRMGWPASVVVAHREHQSGKSDPLGIDMTDFRRTVAELIEGDEVAITDEDVERIRRAIFQTPMDVPGGGGEDVPFFTAVRFAAGRVLQTKVAAYATRDATEALLARADGLDTAAVLARIEQRSAEDAARDAAVQEALDAAAAERQAILDLVAQAGSGERDAVAVVDEIGRRLAGLGQSPA
jgi:hypothetical protein